MQEISQAIDLYKEKAQIKSDAELARRFAVSPQYISRARKTGKLSDTQCLEIARITGLEPAYLLTARNVARSEGDIREAWEKALIFITGIFRCHSKIGVIPAAG